MIYIKLYDKDDVEQADISAKVKIAELSYQMLRNGGCGQAQFVMVSDYEDDSAINVGSWVEFWDDSTAPDTLRYSGRIVDVRKNIEDEETKTVICNGFSQEMEERLVTITAKGCTVKQAITLLFTQFPCPGISFDAGNVAAMPDVLIGEGYSADEVSLSQAITDLCNMQIDGSNQPYYWYVDENRVFYTAAQPAVITKTYSLSTFMAVDGAIKSHNISETRKNIKNKILAIGGNKASGTPYKCIVQDVASILLYGALEGKIVNTRIKDQDLLETWALGQLSRMAYPVVTGSVELSAPGDLTLTGQDYIRLTGFAGGANHDYHPVSVQHNQNSYGDITSIINLSNFKPDLVDIFRQSVSQAQALAGDQQPKFNVALQSGGVFIGGGNADYVIGEAPAFHEEDAGVTTGGFLSDQTINFSGSFTLEFDIEIRARSFGMSTACYVVRNDRFSVELYDIGGTETCPNFNVYDPAGWESCQVALGDSITTGAKKKIRVGFNDSTKYMYLSFDGVKMCDNTGNPATTAAGDYYLLFGGADANKLLDWVGNVKIEMQYREPAEIMIPSIQWLFTEGSGNTVTKSACGKYTATLDGGVAADILWQGSLKQSVGTATIRTTTGQMVTVTGSDLTLTDNSVNFIFAGSDGAWHADTTNTYLDTDSQAILCYIATVVDGNVTGVRDVRPVGGANRDSLYTGTSEGQVNLSAIPGVFRSITASGDPDKFDDGILADATAGNIAIDLTPVETTGKVVAIKKTDASANTVTYSGSGLVDGGASRILTAQNQADIVQFDGTNWQIKASYNTNGTAHTQNTDTGTTNNTFTIDSDSALGKIIIDVATGAADKTLTITNTALTDNRTVTFKDEDGTVAYLTDIGSGATETKSDDYAVDVTDSGKTLIMNNAATKTFTLPSVAAGDIGIKYIFGKIAAGKLIIATSDADTIADSSAGGTIYNDQAGETYATLCVQLFTATGWVITGAHGSWMTT